MHNIDEAHEKGWTKSFMAPITTERKADSDQFRGTAKSSEHESVKQVPTLRTYKRKGSPSHAQQSSPKHGRPKGSTSFVPQAPVPPGVHTKSLSPMSLPVVPGIPEDLIHYSSDSPATVSMERSSLVNLSPHVPPSTLLEPRRATSLPRRIIAQRERRAREKVAKANIQPIHGSRVVPGTPVDIMPLSSAAPDTTPTKRSSMINGCGQPSLTTEVLSPSSPSSGLMCKMGKLLHSEGQVESLHRSKEKKGDKSEQLWSKMDPKTPAVETKLPDVVKGFDSPPIELVKENEAEIMAHETDPTHVMPSTGKRIPFGKTSFLWKSFESMETFHVMPQNPCFRQLEALIEGIREGTAIGLMVNFDSLVKRVGNLCISDSQSTFNEMLESLVTFEENGFDVRRIRSRIEDLLEIKNYQKQFKEEKNTLEEQISGNAYEESRLDTRNRSLDKTIMEVERHLASLHEERDSIYMQRMTIALETDKLQKDVQTAEEACLSVEQRFNTIVASPW